jgi:hypothetical protein
MCVCVCVRACVCVGAYSEIDIRSPGHYRGSERQGEGADRALHIFPSAHKRVAALAECTCD